MEQYGKKLNFDFDFLNNPACFDEEKRQAFFKEYEKDINNSDEFFRTIVYIINQTILSINDLIPSELSDEGKRIAEHCKDVSKSMSDGLTQCENTIRAFTLNDMNLDFLDDRLKYKLIIALKKQMGYFVGEMAYIAIYAMWYRQKVYEYYYGPKENKVKNEVLLTELCAFVKQNAKAFTNALEQISNNMETTNKTLNEIKENQNEIKDNQNETNKLIENRNEAEKPKRRQIAKCAKDICRILKNDFIMVVKQNTIEKYLRRFDEDLNNGKKIALPTYEDAMYYSETNFIVWSRQYFIPYYLEHRKIRGKNKTPRRSSSDAAFDEAARQKYKEENDSY